VGETTILLINDRLISVASVLVALLFTTPADLEPYALKARQCLGEVQSYLQLVEALTHVFMRSLNAFQMPIVQLTAPVWLANLSIAMRSDEV
jgi:hypothetical protein